MDKSHFVIDFDDGKPLPSAGGRDAKLICAILIFNSQSNYPIQGLSDSVDGACYCTSPSVHQQSDYGRMTTRNTNLEGHELQIRVSIFSPFTADFVQPADRFPIQRTNVLEHRNMNTIQRGEWMNGAKSSGALRSPGKRFLETAAECNRLVNEERDKSTANWAKTSMPLCGLDVGSNGKWETVQLSKELQGIVARYSEDSSEGYNETGHSGSV
ncbi:Hypothetical protein PHPALM_6057 [Phytophthora palmivora]|uniref:Uncharacterized protein n=1 Tax=Phytophthora palmivora TaxID=4796 RepID=A0A2P4YFU5_9STRA|nr:Hypothetical protein PHPALM_6057 [Phytophthora palmivora]